jgi:FkbH-like protein
VTKQNTGSPVELTPSERGGEWGEVLSFLDAQRLNSEFAGGPELEFRFAISGTPDPFTPYLKAAGAQQGRAALPRFLPFNTLGQALASAPPEIPEVFLLLPWDLVPEADWRSGVPAKRTNRHALISAAQDRAKQLEARSDAYFLYLPAPLPPLCGDPASDAATAFAIDRIAAELGARRVPREAFSLGTYFGSGCPVSGTWLGKVAVAVVGELCRPGGEDYKVLVTDLDGVVWAGLAADDGIEGIDFGPEGRGYRHFTYQTLLARLRREGTVLAAVTRNDPEVAKEPIKSERMVLKEEDFVAIMASYHPKSAQIRELARQLNLSLSSFVFVDDNPLELSEVTQQLPDVRCVRFPQDDEALPALLADLSRRFSRRELTEEDRERTEMYRRRLEGIAPVDAEGADLTAFLAGLKMRLVLHDRRTGDRTRAVQLINKTNQFNLNGRRWSEEEIAELLERGGHLYGASLSDRSGSHGEILVLMMSEDLVVEAFVMSCRVFQRRVEQAFLCTLVDRGIAPRAMRLAATQKNGPFREFVTDPAFGPPEDGLVPFDAAGFTRGHQDVLGLFEILEG